MPCLTPGIPVGNEVPERPNELKRQELLARWTEHNGAAHLDQSVDLLGSLAFRFVVVLSTRLYSAVTCMCAENRRDVSGERSECDRSINTTIRHGEGEATGVGAASPAAAASTATDVWCASAPAWSSLLRLRAAWIVRLRLGAHIGVGRRPPFWFVRSIAGGVRVFRVYGRSAAYCAVLVSPRAVSGGIVVLAAAIGFGQLEQALPLVGAEVNARGE